MSKVSLKLPPIPWSQARDLVSFLAGRISAQKLFFGGSFIRQCPMVGDIDIAILRVPEDPAVVSTDKSILDLFGEFGVKILSSGQKQKRLIMRYPGFPPYQLDIWLIDDIGQWGPLCMFVAGDAQLNIIQRAKATQLGFMLSQYTVSRNHVSVGDFPTERSVYDFFGWPWIGYTQRNLANARR